MTRFPSIAPFLISTSMSASLTLASCSGSTATQNTLATSAAAPKGTKVNPQCYGKSITICDFPGQYELDKAISLVLKNVQDQGMLGDVGGNTLVKAHVACAEVAYPGGEKTIVAESSRRGTFICLFNNSYSMNMSLNRLSTFIEDFETVDALDGYSNTSWSAKQANEKTMGHNLESPDINRYMRETQTYINNRSLSDDLGTKVEAEFFQSYIAPKIDGNTGKPKSIILGVPLPGPESTQDPESQLTAVLGHEIFHALFFHSDKLQTLVKKYIDGTNTEDFQLLKKRLSQKGYAVVNDDGSPPTQKQTYMFYNETQAYLLESGACTDGAFMSYLDADAEEPKQTIKNTAPLVVKYAAKLRNMLVSEGVITQKWADQWSPDLTKKSGCKS